MVRLFLPKLREVTVRQEGTDVVLIAGNKRFFSLPWNAALVLARAITTQAQRAEELAKREQIIYDQAILTRSGAPFGLTNNPTMLKEAANEAAWNTKLRRYITGQSAKGIESQSIVGTPTIIGGKR